jgi:hypothetical protein
MIYVTHCHFKENYRTGALEPVHDLLPLLEFSHVKLHSVEEARELGILKLMNTNVRLPEHPCWDSQDTFSRMRATLADFNAYPKVNDDYLVLMGNPILIGMAVGLVMERCRTFNVLQWNKHGQCYRVKKVKQDV